MGIIAVPKGQEGKEKSKAHQAAAQAVTCLSQGPISVGTQT